MKLSKLKQKVLYPLLALAVFLMVTQFFPFIWPFKFKPRPATPAVTMLPAAPRLTLTDLAGNTFNTANFKGKVVVVNLWAAWCTPCAAEVPRLIALQQKYQDNGLQIIGISIDDSDKELRDFYQRHKINYPVVAGDQKLADAYGGILGLPTTLVINRDGLIEKKFIGAADFAMLEQEIISQLQKVPPADYR